MFRLAFLLSIFCLITATATAAPRAYDFDYSASRIEFIYDFNGDTVKGRFPEFTGDLVIDFADMRKSKVSVSIETGSARGGFVFATSALRGPKILDAKAFPRITFRSIGAKVVNGIAKVDGEITVRDITRPITLTARFFRLEGHDPADRDELALQITGQFNRHEFGASGYDDMVGETLDIRILAKIKRQP